MEIASADSQGRRLAVRLLPTIKVREPIQEYQSLVKTFGGTGIWLLNGKEVLLRGGSITSVDDVHGTKQPFCMINTRYGTFVFSYRPFANASVLGYFDGNAPIFELNGDVYEWVSTDGPVLPEGRWAAYAVAGR